MKGTTTRWQWNMTAMFPRSPGADAKLPNVGETLRLSEDGGEMQAECTGQRIG